MSPFPLRAASWLALCLLLVGSPFRPALAADDFQRYLEAAVQLYENLEYERALAQVQRARTVARGVEQDVSLSLHEGIFLAEMGRWREARTSFETALLLEPTARLPLSVSPKVESQFESIRQDVNTAISRRKQGANAGTAAPAPATATTDAKPESASPMASAKSLEQKPVAASEVPAQELVEAVSEENSEQTQGVASDRPEQAQPVLLTPPEPSPALTPSAEVAPSRAPVIPLLLLGTAALAGSVGGYYAASPGTQAELSQNKATAGIMFGMAGVALASSAVTWLIMQADTPDEPVAESSAP